MGDCRWADPPLWAYPAIGTPPPGAAAVAVTVTAAGPQQRTECTATDKHEMADESYAIALLRQAGLREGVLQHEALAVVKLRPEDEEQHLAGEWVFAGVRRTEKQLILCFELLEDLKADDHVSDTDMRKTLTYTHVFQDHNPVSGETRIFYLYNYEVVDTPGQSLYYEYPEVLVCS